MDFAETQFPTDIAYGSAGGPVFATELVVGASGAERRNRLWSQARARYQVGTGVKSEAQMRALIAFFRARGGRATGFRFKDWSDFQGVNEPLGVGNGAQKKFQLVRRYGNGGQEQLRPVLKPVGGTVRIYVDGALVSGLSISTVTGVVSFATAPASGVVLTADFEFDVPVRFDTDALEITLEDVGAQNVRDLPLIELRLPTPSLE